MKPSGKTGFESESGIRIYSVGVLNPSYTLPSDTISPLEFTPLEFETVIKFKRKAMKQYIRIYSVGV